MADTGIIAKTLEGMGKMLAPTDDEKSMIMRALLSRRGGLEDAGLSQEDVDAGMRYLAMSPSTRAEEVAGAGEEIATLKAPAIGIPFAPSKEKLTGINPYGEGAVADNKGIFKGSLAPEASGLHPFETPKNLPQENMGYHPFVKGAEKIMSQEATDVLAGQKAASAKPLSKERAIRPYASQTDLGIYGSAVSRAQAEISSEIDGITKAVGEGTMGEDEGRQLVDIAENKRMEKTTMHWINMRQARDGVKPTAQQAKAALGPLFDPMQFSSAPAPESGSGNNTDSTAGKSVPGIWQK